MIIDKPSWIHQSKETAIKWDNDLNKWKVEDLGCSPTAGIIGPSSNNSPPNQINNGWRYWNGAEWVDTNAVHFEDWTFRQGKFLHLLCKNFVNYMQNQNKSFL